jgi:hypothetical protein
MTSGFRRMQKYDSVAQLVEQYTFNVWVLGSNPSGITDEQSKRPDGNRQGAFRFCVRCTLACKRKAEAKTQREARCLLCSDSEG